MTSFDKFIFSIKFEVTPAFNQWVKSIRAKRSGYHDCSIWTKIRKPKQRFRSQEPKALAKSATIMSEAVGTTFFNQPEAETALRRFSRPRASMGAEGQSCLHGGEVSRTTVAPSGDCLATQRVRLTSTVVNVGDI